MKPQQAEIIDAVLAGKDCLAVMPTGGGKSASYVIPGLLKTGVTIVVSPLNTLIADQITYLVSRGVIEAVIHFQLMQFLMHHFIFKVKATCDPFETDGIAFESFMNNSRHDCGNFPV